MKPKILNICTFVSQAIVKEGEYPEGTGCVLFSQQTESAT